MRRYRLLLPFVCLINASCVSFGDGVGALALDYRIDRTRVVGINLNPPNPVQGETVTIDALVLGPDPVEAFAVDVCGLNPDLPTELYGIDCFQNETLITPIAPRIPARWEVPMLGRDCVVADTGGEDTESTDECASVVPMRVRAWTTDEVASGAVEVTLERSRAPGPRPRLMRAPRELAYLGEATRGAEIGLTYRVDWEGDLEFSWYVDKGELHHTGRTATTWLNGTRHTTRNQLSIPVGWVGPLRVVVVASAGPGNMAWDILTLEVE
jgi:hypothetical protein